jgi:hypothetical protein
LSDGSTGCPADAWFFQDAGFGFLADAPAARKMRIKWR